MKKVLIAGVIFGVWLAAAPGGAQERAFDRAMIRLNYWTADYTGKLTLEDADVLGGTTVLIGDEIDLVDDLGLVNPRAVPEVEAQLRLGKRHQFSLSWYQVVYRGDVTLDQTVNLAGYQFALNTDLETEFKSQRYKFTYEFSPIRSDRASLGIVAGVEFYDLVVSYDGQASQGGINVTVSDSQRLPAPIPVAGLNGSLFSDFGLGVYGSAVGMGVSISGVQASYLDLDGGLAYRHQWFYTGLGYRFINFRVDAPEISDDMSFNLANSHQGWYFSLGARI